MANAITVFADWGAIWPRIFAFCVIGLFVGVPIGAVWLKRAGSRRLDAIKAEVLSMPGATAGRLVGIVFHTYHGLLVFTIQTTHQLRLSPAAAEELLKRFQRFNSTWGLLSYGCFVIPFLSKSEYKSQLRSISEQQKW